MLPNRCGLLIATGLLFMPDGHAQAAPQRTTFEVASVKPNNNCQINARPALEPGRFALPCNSLRSLIQMAYGSFEDLARRPLEVRGGPGWLDSDRYEVLAKADNGASLQQMSGPMLQALLQERFKVRVHKETRESPVYDLILVNQKASKLVPAKEGSCMPLKMSQLAQLPTKSADGQPIRYCGTAATGLKGSNYVLDCYGVSLAEFTGSYLPRYVDRPVVDKTGVTGQFDVHLEFSRRIAEAATRLLNGVPVPASSPADDESGPSIFTAIQEQLGLKLSAGKGPIEVVVVDQAERLSPN